MLSDAVSLKIFMSKTVKIIFSFILAVIILAWLLDTTDFSVEQFEDLIWKREFIPAITILLFVFFIAFILRGLRWALLLGYSDKKQKIECVEIYIFSF